VNERGQSEAITPTSNPRAWWHGCWLKPGHYLFDRRGNSGNSMDPCPVRSGLDEAYWLDGGLAPRMLRIGARVKVMADRIAFTRMACNDRDLRYLIELHSDECPQGEFLLHAIAGCTIAAWWDRTQGDTRGACNSCLIVEGGHGANQMLALFPRLFPVQAGRLAKAGVTLRFLRWDRSVTLSSATSTRGLPDVE
jgi:hypothetical protein